jgi:hypothetical protein
MNTLPPIGSKAKVAPVDSVATYCHGQVGTVTEHRHSKLEGQTVAVLAFETPVPRHWQPGNPLKSLGLRADQITLL